MGKFETLHHGTGTYNTWTFCPKCPINVSLCLQAGMSKVLKYPSAEIFQCQNVPNADQCSGNGPMVQWIPYSWGALGSNIFPISISKTWSASWTKKSGHGISSQNTKTYFFHIIWQKPNKVVQSEVLNSNMYPWFLSWVYICSLRSTYENIVRVGYWKISYWPHQLSHRFYTYFSFEVHTKIVWIYIIL